MGAYYKTFDIAMTLCWTEGDKSLEMDACVTVCYEPEQEDSRLNPGWPARLEITEIRNDKGEKIARDLFEMLATAYEDNEELWQKAEESYDEQLAYQRYEKTAY